MPFQDTLLNTGLKTLIDRFLPISGSPQTATSLRSPSSSLGVDLTDRNLQTLIGALLAGTAAVGRDEPGYITESRQILRNIQEPEKFGQVFGRTVSGLQEPFLPLLKQQAELGIQDVAQRAKALFPATAGLQGPALSAMESYIRERLAPTQQAFLGNLGLTGLTQQQQAARTILGMNEEDQLRRGLADLARAFLAGGIFGGKGSSIEDLRNAVTGARDGTSSGGGPGGGIPGLPELARKIEDIVSGSVLTNTLSANLGSVLPAVAGGVSSLTLPLISQLFGAPGATQAIAPLAAAENPATVAALEQALGVTPSAAAPATGTAGFQGLIGAPGLASVQALLSALGSGVGGFLSGRAIGQQLPETQLGGTASGAAGGAAAGFLVGGPIGAAIGAVSGGVGGFTGSRSVSHQQKQANLLADQNAQASQVRAVSDFFLPQIEAVGGNTASLMDRVSGYISSVNQPGDQIGDLADFLSNEFVKQAKTIDPSVNSIADVPGMREKFIGFMIQNAFVAPKAGEQRPLSQLEAEALGARAGIDTSTPGIAHLKVAQYGPIVQEFQNVDRASSAEVANVVSQLRAAGYTGPLTRDISPGGAGRRVVQDANALLQGHLQGWNPQQIFSEYSLIPA